MTSSSKGIRALLERTGVKDPWIGVRLLADRLRAQCTRTEPPFLTDEFCDRARILIERVPLPCDARITSVPGGGFVAEVCSTHSFERQRFSLCHEIGHTFFASDRGRLFKQGCGTSAYNLEERLCNYAAAELLMPTDLFTAAARSHAPSWEGIDHLATTFFTSAQATLARCIEVNAWPVLALQLEQVNPNNVYDGFRLLRREETKTAFGGDAAYQKIAENRIMHAVNELADVKLIAHTSVQDDQRTEGSLYLEPLRTTMHLKFQRAVYSRKPGLAVLGFAAARS